MAQFQFRLKTLLAMRESLRDERKAELAETQAALRSLNDRQAALARELDEQKQRCRAGTAPGRVDVGGLMTTHRYELVLREELTTLADQEQVLAADIELRRQAVVAADGEVRVLEKLHEKKFEQFRQQQAQVENKQLDEVAARAADQADAM
jgi:flagellar FliJ protein